MRTLLQTQTEESGVFTKNQLTSGVFLWGELVSGYFKIFQEPRDTALNNTQYTYVLVQNYRLSYIVLHICIHVYENSIIFDLI